MSPVTVAVLLLRAKSTDRDSAVVAGDGEDVVVAIEVDSNTTLVAGDSNHVVVALKNEGRPGVFVRPCRRRRSP